MQVGETRGKHTDGAGFLQRRHGRVADASVRGGNVLDKLGRTHEPAHAPAGCVKVLARGANGDGEALDFGGKRGDPREGNVVQAVVYLVGKDDDLILDT